MTDLYQPQILREYRNPRNTGVMKNPTHQARALNSSCGDEITVYLKTKNSKLSPYGRSSSRSGSEDPSGSRTTGGKILDIKYEARGCALTIASASFLSEKIKGKKTQEINKLDLKDVEKLLGTKIAPARQPCVLLPLDTVKKAIKK